VAPVDNVAFDSSFEADRSFARYIAEKKKKKKKKSPTTARSNGSNSFRMHATCRLRFVAQFRDRSEASASRPAVSPLEESVQRIDAPTLSGRPTRG